MILFIVKLLIKHEERNDPTINNLNNDINELEKIFMEI